MSRSRATWVALWALTVGVTLVARPPWPVDETRYLAVAWRMWSLGDLLVPRLGALPYDDKPPLLFWLMHAGWALGGVHAAWARLVPPLFALASLALTGRLARRLWPDAPAAAELAPLLLAGALLWTLWSTLLMFDALVACFALLSVLAVVDAARGGGLRAHAALAGALGAGLLAKGPVLLLHVLPAALLAPWWARPTRATRAPDPPRAPHAPGAASWARYYGGLLVALACGCLPALAWVALAGRGADGLSEQALLVDQTLKRLVGEAEHVHAEPWWHYLALLPLVALPWTAWPRLLGALRRRLAAPRDEGERLCLAWAGTALLVSSAIPAKQVHYLVPLLPPLALLAARALAAAPAAPRRLDALPAALLPALCGAALLALRAGRLSGPAWTSDLPAWPGLALLAAAPALGLPRTADAGAAARRLSLSSAVVLLVALCGVLPSMLPTVDVRPAAHRIAAWQAEGRPVASTDKVRGEYDFAGRLRHAVVFLEPYEVAAWADAHPGGVLLTTDESPRDGDPAPPLASFGTGLRAWDAGALPARLRTRHLR